MAASSQTASVSSFVGAPITATGSCTGRQPMPFVIDWAARTAPSVPSLPCT